MGLDYGFLSTAWCTSLRSNARDSVRLLVAVCLAAMCLPVHAAMELAAAGVAHCVIITQAGATPAERYAAEELAAALNRITGATFPIQAGHRKPARVGHCNWPGTDCGQLRFQRWTSPTSAAKNT